MLNNKQIEELHVWLNELEEKKRQNENTLSFLRSEAERLQFRMKVAENMPQSQFKQVVVTETTREYQDAVNTLETNELTVINNINNFEALIVEINKLLK